MATAEIVKLPGVEVPRSELLRMLGYRRGGRPSARVERRIETIWSEALDLIAPIGAWRVLTRAEAQECGVPTPTATVGIGLATIGKALEARVTECGAGEQPLDALLLDAIGSVAAEAVTNAINARICSYATGAGHNPAPRISPGYGGWSIGSQPALLSLLPAAAVGIELTEQGMMVPHKSVSFAVRFRSTTSTSRTLLSRCMRCGMRSCVHRIEEPA